MLGPNGAARTSLSLEEELSSDRGVDGVGGDEGPAARNTTLLLLGGCLTPQEENKNLQERRSRDILMLMLSPRTAPAAVGGSPAGSGRGAQLGGERGKEPTNRRLSSASAGESSLAG